MKLLFLISVLFLLILMQSALSADSTDRTEYYNDGTYYMADGVEDSNDKSLDGTIVEEGFLTKSYGWGSSASDGGFYTSNPTCFKGDFCINLTRLGADIYIEHVWANTTFNGLVSYRQYVPASVGDTNLRAYSEFLPEGIGNLFVGYKGDQSRTKWSCSNAQCNVVDLTYNFDNWDLVVFNWTAADNTVDVYVNGIHIHHYTNAYSPRTFRFSAINPSVSNSYLVDDFKICKSNVCPQAPPPDTCTAPGSGDWNVDCSDNCVLDSAQDVPGDMHLNGIGTIVLSAPLTFTGSNQIFSVASGCTLDIRSGGKIGGT